MTDGPSESGDLINQKDFCSPAEDTRAYITALLFRKIQNLVFPNGVFWDKEKREFRTHEKNSVFAILDTLVAENNKKTEADFSTSVPLCG